MTKKISKRQEIRAFIAKNGPITNPSVGNGCIRNRPKTIGKK